MTKNDMLLDPAVVLTSKNPSLSQPNAVDILMESLRLQAINQAGAAGTYSDFQSKNIKANNNRGQQRRRQPQNQNQPQNNGNQKSNHIAGNGSNPVRQNNQNRSRNSNSNMNNSNMNNSNQMLSYHLRKNLYLNGPRNYYQPFSPVLPSTLNFPIPHQKLGVSNEHVSREINEYYARNRQTNEQFQSKQIIRGGLERTLQEALPNYSINLYLVGSSTNGIGDTPNAADICIIVRKREAKPIVNADGEEVVIKTDEPADKPSSSPTSPAPSSSTPKKEEITTDKADFNYVFVDAETEAPNNETDKVSSSNDEKASKASPKSPKIGPSEKSKIEEKSPEFTKLPSDIPQDSPRNESIDGDYESHYSEVTSEISLQDVEKILQGKGFAQNVQLIPAKVPVIKFTDSITGLNVTLNLNQEVSIRNSQLIRDYCKMDWRFAPLAMIFKRWAQENRICNAVEQTISSYSWTLMTIHYLQVCEPPVLPCLQKANPRRYEQHRGDIFKAIKFWRRQSPRPWQSENNQNLRQLLKGLFRYYGYVYNYNQHVISVREGRVLDRSHFSRRALVEGKTEQWIPHYWTSFLAIEEPFTKTNTACSVHDKEKFDRIVDLFRLSSSSLRGVRISLFNIIADDVYFPITY